MSIPSSMKAVILVNNDAVLKSDVPVPALKDGGALVRVRAVAINPIDFKSIDHMLGDEGTILGCDYAGEIVALADNADPSFSIGDTVCGFLRGASRDSFGSGAFSEYLVADLPTTMKIPLKPATLKELPAGKVETFEAAATLPLCLYTVTLAIAHSLDSKLLWQPAQPQHDHPILVWGGATVCGQYAIQLLKNLNAYTKIVVVASKQHEPLLKQYGADDLFDYNDENVEDKIKAKYPNIYHALDMASFPETLRSVNKLVPTDKPVKIIQLLLNENAIPEDERKDNVTVDFPLSFHISGHDEKLGPFTLKYQSGIRETIISFIKLIVPKITDGSFFHAPARIAKGIESIPEGIEQVRKGTNHGFKVTISI